MSNPSPKSKEDKIPFFSYPIQNIIKLDSPLDNPLCDFFKVIAERKSTRIFDWLTLEQLAHLLWYTAKATATYCDDNGYVLSHRPSPSAGARHPIDLIIHRPEAGGLEYYNPFEHSLGTLKLDKKVVHQFLNHVRISMPNEKGTLVWFVAHSFRTEAKYENADSLIWRDVGAFLQTIQLTATAMGISSCAIGTLAEPFITMMFGQNTGILSGGGIIVGNNLVF